MKFEHANHNFEACTYLGRVVDYPDWIITTAFYSAVHYVDDLIFPIEKMLNNKKVIFTCIENYARFFKIGRHDARLSLVEEKFDSMYPLFKKLFDASYCARYTDYKAYNFKDAQQFYNDAEEIKNFALTFK